MGYGGNTVLFAPALIGSTISLQRGCGQVELDWVGAASPCEPRVRTRIAQDGFIVNVRLGGDFFYGKIDDSNI